METNTSQEKPKPTVIDKSELDKSIADKTKAVKTQQIVKK